MTLMSSILVTVLEINKCSEKNCGIMEDSRR